MPGVLKEQADLVHGKLLPPELLGGDAGNGRRLQVEQDRPGDGGARRTDSQGAGRSVRASDVAVAVGDEAGKSLHRIEQVAAVGHADELLFDTGPVVLHPGLDQVGSGGEREIVHQLQPRVEGRVDGKEEGQPDAEAVLEVHGDVGKGPAAQSGELGRTGRLRAGEQRSPVPARPVLAGSLHAQLVGEGVGQQRAEAGVDRVRAVSFDPVGRGSPGIDVEGAVHLFRPGVVVLDRGLVAAVEVEVELGQQRARVVGAPDVPELVVEQARPARLQKALQALQVLGIADAAGRLLGLGRRLLVVGQEEEGPVPHQRAAHCPTQLIAVEVGPLAAALLRKGGGDLIPLPEVMGGAGQMVGARLGDYVDEAAGRAAELGGGALIHHHQLLDRVLIEGEGRTLAAALLAEEGIVEVGAVDDEVVEDAALAADVERVAVRSLRDGGARCEQRQVHEVATVARKSIHHVLQNPLRAGDVRGVEGLRQFADDGDGLGRHDLERHGQVEHFSNPQPGPLDAFDTEVGARYLHGHVIGPRGQQGAHEGPGGRSLHRGPQIGLPMLQNHHRSLHRISEGIADGAADGAGGRPSLGGRFGRVLMEEHGGRQRDGEGDDQATWGAEAVSVRHGSMRDCENAAALPPTEREMECGRLIVYWTAIRRLPARFLQLDRALPVDSCPRYPGLWPAGVAASRRRVSSGVSRWGHGMMTGTGCQAAHKTGPALGTTILPPRRITLQGVLANRCWIGAITICSGTFPESFRASG